MSFRRSKEIMIMKFKTVLTGIAAGIFLSLPAQAAVADRIVAVVNDGVITLSELNGAFDPYRAKLEAAYTGLERDKALAETRMTLLNRMIDGLLMEQESRKTGIVVGDEEVSDAIKDILAKRNISQEEFRKSLIREGTTLAAYRKDIRDQLMRIKLIRRDIKSKVAVTEEEIGEYYRRHRGDYEGQESVRIRQILLLLPKEADQAAKEKLRADAEGIHGRLLGGESFDELAARHSEGPAAAAGGDIGFVERGVIIPEVEEAAFRLPLRQISGVIESSLGFHIIQVIDRRGAGIKAVETVREEIREKIDREKMEKKFEEWLEALRKKSHIEIKL